MPRPPNRKVMVITFCDSKPVSSPGGGTSWSYYDLELPELLELGPYLEEIQAFTVTKGATTNVETKVVFYSSISGREWLGPTDLFSAINSDGQAIQTAYTATENLGIFTRFALAVRASTGTAVEAAVMTVKAAFVFKS